MTKAGYLTQNAWGFSQKCRLIVPADEPADDATSKFSQFHPVALSQLTPKYSDVWKITEGFMLWNQVCNRSKVYVQMGIVGKVGKDISCFSAVWMSWPSTETSSLQTQPIIIRQVHLKLEMIFQFHLYQRESRSFSDSFNSSLGEIKKPVRLLWHRLVASCLSRPD